MRISIAIRESGHTYDPCRKPSAQSIKPLPPATLAPEEAAVKQTTEYKKIPYNDMVPP